MMRKNNLYHKIVKYFERIEIRKKSNALSTIPPDSAIQWRAYGWKPAETGYTRNNT